MFRALAVNGGRPLKALALTWLLLLTVFMFMPGAASAASEPQVRLLDVDGTITPVMANYINHGIRDAADADASAVILRMDTPGGLGSAMDDITQTILNSPVPVIVYVAPSGARAASAGVYITYAAHVAAMAPSTNIGSATPIFVGSDGQVQDPGDTATRKAVNDAVARIKNLAQLRGRNADWAEQAVTQAENISAADALSMHVVDVVANDVPDLLNQIDGKTVTMAGGATTTLHTRDAAVRSDDMGLPDQLLQLISDPTIAYLVLSLGMLGIFLELAHPGAILPGVLGGICLLVGLFGLGSLHASWAGMALMGFGFILFLVDVYVTSHGVLTIGGIVSFAFGSFMLMNSASSPALQISKIAIVSVTVLLALFGIFVVGAVARSRARRTQTGREGIVGAVGTVRERLNPDGYVFVEGELWKASSPAGPLEPGTPVRVIEINGLRLAVMPMETEERALAAAQTN